jgi:hypothetical protein
MVVDQSEVCRDSQQAFGGAVVVVAAEFSRARYAVDSAGGATSRAGSAAAESTFLPWCSDSDVSRIPPPAGSGGISRLASRSIFGRSIVAPAACDVWGGLVAPNRNEAKPRTQTNAVKPSDLRDGHRCCFHDGLTAASVAAIEACSATGAGDGREWTGDSAAMEPSSVEEFGVPSLHSKAEFTTSRLPGYPPPLMNGDPGIKHPFTL